jgi:hypothetical protein
MPKKTARYGAVVAVDAAEAKRRNPIDSRAGKAMSAPVPRRKWRRLKDVFM